MNEYTYHIEPASSTSFWYAAPIVLILAIAVIFIISMLYYSRNTVVVVSNDSIKVKGGLYGKTLPMSILKLENAKIINLLREKDYDLKTKANGIGVTGYYSGWYKLNNGEKALVYVTEKRRVLYLPTNEEYVLLMSLDNPQEFLERLQEPQIE